MSNDERAAQRTKKTFNSLLFSALLSLALTLFRKLFERDSSPRSTRGTRPHTNTLKQTLNCRRLFASVARPPNPQKLSLAKCEVIIGNRLSICPHRRNAIAKCSRGEARLGSEGTGLFNHYPDPDAIFIFIALGIDIDADPSAGVACEPTHCGLVCRPL